MKKQIKDIAKHEKDTGSSEVQIGLLTEKISYLSEHIKKNLCVIGKTLSPFVT